MSCRPIDLQAIVWISDDRVHRHIYASCGLIRLMWMLLCFNWHTQCGVSFSNSFMYQRLPWNITAGCQAHHSTNRITAAKTHALTFVICHISETTNVTIFRGVNKTSLPYRVNYLTMNIAYCSACFRNLSWITLQHLADLLNIIIRVCLWFTTAGAMKLCAMGIFN